MMADKTKLLQDLLGEIPDALASLRDEGKLMGKDIINSQIEKANLVSREEFLTQQALLEALIEKVDTLETLIKANAKHPQTPMTNDNDEWKTMHSNENKIDYIEIPVNDIEESKSFFKAIFGWDFKDYNPHYTVFKGAGISGGWPLVVLALIPPKAHRWLFFTVMI